MHKLFAVLCSPAVDSHPSLTVVSVFDVIRNISCENWRELSDRLIGSPITDEIEVNKIINFQFVYKKCAGKQGLTTSPSV